MNRAVALMSIFFFVLPVLALLPACGNTNVEGDGTEDTADAAGETPDVSDGRDFSETSDPGPEEMPAEAPQDAPAEDLARDVSEEDVTEESDCVGRVPSPIDALQGTGDYLPGMDAGHFCARGSATFTIVSIPASEIDAIHNAPIPGETYYQVFALSNTENRNYDHAWITRQRDTTDSPIVVKMGGGSCIECNCCPCLLSPLPDGWCGSAITRPASPTFTEGAQYTMSWDSDGSTICFRKGSGGEACIEELPVPYAFNRYCGGAGCSLIHWGPARWTSGSVTLDDFQCGETVTTVSPSCP